MIISKWGYSDLSSLTRRSEAYLIYETEQQRER